MSAGWKQLDVQEVYYPGRRVRAEHRQTFTLRPRWVSGGGGLGEKSQEGKSNINLLL